jgi:hypothetical protein
MSKESLGVTLLKKGSKIVGSAVGGAIGYITVGPLGTPGMAAIGGQLLSEIANRVLSDKEKIRIGAAAAIALSDIGDRLRSGEKLRNDNFFERESDTNRSTAEELFEGVLLRARDEYEEKKLKLLGKLYSNLTFDISCSKHEGNYLINVANSLTYTQLCLVNIFKNKNLYNLRSEDFKDGEMLSTVTLNCLQQSFDLFQKGYLLFRVPNENTDTLVLQVDQITPAHVNLSLTGNRIYDLLSLDEIDAQDLEDIASHLKGT